MTVWYSNVYNKEGITMNKNLDRTRLPTPKIDVIEGLMSLDECRIAIESHGININTDMSSYLCNSGRIASLRSLLDLFETYNKALNEKEKN